jgi:hypothetical protein
MCAPPGAVQIGAVVLAQDGEGMDDLEGLDQGRTSQNVRVEVLEDAA